MKVLPLDFMGQNALIEPLDKELHDLAIDFCKRELTEEVNLSNFAKVWVAKDAEQIQGIMGYVLKPDVPLMRATSAAALRAMANRYNDYLADNGARGKETFVYVSKSEKAEQKCPEWRQVLREWGARFSDRVTVTVR